MQSALLASLIITSELFFNANKSFNLALTRFIIARSLESLFLLKINYFDQTGFSILRCVKRAYCFDK